jgi:hypothetical protein
MSANTTSLELKEATTPELKETDYARNIDKYRSIYLGDSPKASRFVMIIHEESSDKEISRELSK